ncbi:MAG: GNAT family N-acetyltransferase [Alphaproteobacteria bacterium]|nr:GNAT family N-acetyltransferase [Alphaproteobacteria bacterium]
MWIERYEPRWHSHVIELANTVFGDGYFSEPWHQTQQADTFMFVAREDDPEVVGLALGRILPKQSLRAYLGPQVTEISPDIVDADKAGVLGVIEEVAVAQNHRRLGIGYDLMRATHDALIGAGADKLLVTFKRGPGATAVDNLMGTLGFDLWQKLPSYWRDACNRGDFKCVDRQDQCVCEAMLFRKVVF